MNTFNHARKHIQTISTFSVLLALFIIFQIFTLGSDPAIEAPNPTPATFAVVSHQIPTDLQFAGELVPADRYDVKEAFERELLVNAYWQSQTLLFIKRSTRYFPIIEPILKTEGIPDDFKYLALIESSFMPRAESPAGAAGIWQFMKETGKLYGLEITPEVDERYHIEKSTKAACQYFKNAKDKFGTWTLAAASYNAGIAGIKKQIDKQKEASFYDLLLSEETNRYIYRILAAKEILCNPVRYGFHVSPDEMYLPVPSYELSVTSTISDIADFAKSKGTTYKELKNLNPWLRETFLNVAPGKSYAIRLPGQP